MHARFECTLCSVHISYFPLRTMYQNQTWRIFNYLVIINHIWYDSYSIQLEINTLDFVKRSKYVWIRHKIESCSILFFLLTSFSASSFAIRSMGFGKMKTIPGHHRKRLAVDSSRHHLRPDDSHMFVVKLPPNPYYYSNTNTGHSKNAIADENTKVRMCNVYSLHTSV